MNLNLEVSRQNTITSALHGKVNLHHCRCQTGFSKQSGKVNYLLDIGLCKTHWVKEPSPEQDYVSSASQRLRVQQQKAEIAEMEANLRQPKSPEAIAIAERLVRHSINEKISSEQFRHFITTTRAQDGEQWPVAILTAERARQIELCDQAGVIRLTSQSVNHRDHQARWSKLQNKDWEILQHLIDKGEWLALETKPIHREVWGSIVDKWWKVVFKETSLGELMLITYYRLKLRDVRKQERKQYEQANKVA